MTPLLLSRTLDPRDYETFVEELRIVDRIGIPGQHEHRRWEYALALKAVTRWRMARENGHPLLCYDVGGAGSLFSLMLNAWTESIAIVVDPHASQDPTTLEAFVHSGTPLADVVTCLSVIEHVKDASRFCYYLACLLAPGGLLVLTMDYWDKCGADTAHFAHMRERIYCQQSLNQLRTICSQLGLTTFGGVDPTYHGAQVYNYTFASLVLEKRR